jgi:hypothetical protein
MLQKAGPFAFTQAEGLGTVPQLFRWLDSIGVISIVTRYEKDSVRV